MDDFSLLFASDDWKYFEGRAAVVVIVIRFIKGIIFAEIDSFSALLSIRPDATEHVGSLPPKQLSFF